MDSRRRIYENFTDMTPEEMNAVTRHGINVLSKDRRDAVLKQLDPSVMQDKLRNSFESVYSHTRSRNAAIDYVINAFSSPLDPDTAIDIYGKYGTTGKKIVMVITSERNLVTLYYKMNQHLVCSEMLISQAHKLQEMPYLQICGIMENLIILLYLLKLNR